VTLPWLRRYKLRAFGSVALHLAYAALGAIDVIVDHRAAIWLTPLEPFAGLRDGVGIRAWVMPMLSLRRLKLTRRESIVLRRDFCRARCLVLARGGIAVPVGAAESRNARFARSVTRAHAARRRPARGEATHDARAQPPGPRFALKRGMELFPDIAITAPHRSEACRELRRVLLELDHERRRAGELTRAAARNRQVAFKASAAEVRVAALRARAAQLRRAAGRRSGVA
jgi:hypothetical protein